MIGVAVCVVVLAVATGTWLRAGHVIAASSVPWAVAALAGLLVGVTWRPAATAVVVGGLAGVSMVWAALDRRNDGVDAADIAAALEVLARALRAGASPRQALADTAQRTPGPLGADLQILVDRAARGVPLAWVLRSWPTLRPNTPAVRPASAALALALETGASAARAVDDVADTVRAQHELGAEVRALASQAQASAALIGGLPVVFAFTAGALDSRTLSFLVSTSMGRACLLAGLGLDVAGWWWMRRIVSGVRV